MTQRIALVTGASRGIGRAIALRLAEAGKIVIGTATTETGAENIRQALAERGFSGGGLALNVADPDSIAAVLKKIGSTWGDPLILVNNAAITRDNLLMRMKDEEWQNILDTNLTSVYRMSKAVLRAMTKERFGRIVNIASVVAQTGNAGQTNYAAAKAGMIGFTKSLAKEIGSRNVTVNAVAPGFIDTDMTRSLPEAHRQALLGAIPLGRLGTAEEVAHAVVFLCSEQAAYITGETLNVNGGMYMP
jgi:3-oxoacyl-[acyl-carrier protein] reductase